MTKRFGFTLAEVLITLTIIGVIASMTIPTLMNSTADTENRTGLKKAISTLNQAITMQYALDGTDLSEFTGADPFVESNGLFSGVLMKRMQVMKTTSARDTSRGHNKTTGNKAIYLQDGMVIEFSTAKTGKSCAANVYSASNPTGCLFTILVDVNGDKGKCSVSEGKAADTTTNKAAHKAKDCFPLDVYPDGVRPATYVGQEIMYGANSGG